MHTRLSILLSLCLAGCVSGSKLLADSEVLTSDIERARRNGALQCAPVELATAEANLEFGLGELSQGNSARASDHIRTADTAVQKALALSRDCAGKQVLVRDAAPVVVRVEPTDADGDGVLDPDDRCPGETEDKDGFQDDDGCPELDNDADGVLDAADRCPMAPGAVEQGGCPAEAPTDADADGVADAEDRCPSQPEDKDGVQDEDGCPDLDNDGDGLLDAADQCPNQSGPPTLLGCPVRDRDNDGLSDPDDKCAEEPEDKDGFQDEDGCPDLDNDGDGVPDAQDRCPDVAGVAQQQGCADQDGDGDGLTDTRDTCPNETEDKDGFEDEDGCPDIDNDKDGMPDTLDKCPQDAGVPELLGCPDKDGDGDGIVDRQDACPEEPGISEEKGCPKRYKRIIVKKERIELKQQIRFGSGSARIIGRESQAILDEIATALQENPRIKRVRIEGHTDSRGSDTANLRLSQKRADAVKAGLIKRGVDPVRLISVGYGEAKPIAPNTTAKGRALNRRTEFNIVD